MVTKLYKDSVLIDFSEAGHRYKVSLDGGKTWKAKKGVTTILSVLNKPALMLWPMKMALDYVRQGTFLDHEQYDDRVLDLDHCLEEASKAHTVKADKGANLGTEIHGMVEDYLKGNLHGVSKELQPAYDGFVKWFEDNKVKPIAVEQVVYSKALDYCGKYDCLLEIDGKVVLADIKSTASGIWPDNFVQLGGYAEAFEEEQDFSDEIDDLLILNVPVTGKVKAKYSSELDLKVVDCEQAFVDTIQMYRFMDKVSNKLRGKYAKVTK